MMILRLTIPLVAMLMGSWLLYDGVRSLTRGDFTTPRTGPHAGQLGPWAGVVSALGVNPRGTGMKIAHVVLGATWLMAGVLFIVRPSLGQPVLIGTSVCTLWYLPLGTVLALVELGLLLLPQLRNFR